MLVIGSPDYLRAIERDLLTAARRLDDDRGLVVISSRDVEKTSLKAYAIISDSRLQKVLGGARTSLHARIARELLYLAVPYGWVVEKLREGYKTRLGMVLERSVRQRQRVTNDGLRRFIGDELKANPRIGATNLLRRLRESGRACEQGRFKVLFGEVRKGRGES
jgi:hypothetical protein